MGTVDILLPVDSAKAASVAVLKCLKVVYGKFTRYCVTYVFVRIALLKLNFDMQINLCFYLKHTTL